jgi:hypothetical protein
MGTASVLVRPWVAGSHGQKDSLPDKPLQPTSGAGVLGSSIGR